MFTGKTPGQGRPGFLLGMLNGREDVKEFTDGIDIFGGLSVTGCVRLSARN